MRWRALVPALILVAGTSAACGGSSGRGTCPSGARFCDGDIVRECLSDGVSSRVIVDCAPDASCRNGVCVPLQVSSDTTATLPDSELLEVATEASDQDPLADGWPSPGADAPTPDGPFDGSDPSDPVGPPHDDASIPDEARPDIVPDESGSPPPDAGVTPDTAEETSDLPRDATDPLEDTAYPACNSGHLDPGEECDGEDFGGMTCGSLGYGPGTLLCRSDCTIDTLLCGPDSHRLAYDAVPNAWYKDDFVDVAWHPKGTYAVLLSRTGAVVRFDPGAEPMQALALIGSTGGVTPTRAAFHPSGDAFVVGYDAEGVGHVFRVPDGGLSLADLPDARQPARFVSIRFQESGTLAMIVGQSGSYSINYLCLFDPATLTTTNFKGYNASAGVADLAWVPAGVLPAGPAALIVHGWNGVDAKLWYLVSNEIVPTPGSLGGFGNMGRAAWRPGGLYGLVSGTSSNVLYVFNGTWTKAYLTGTGSGILDVAFRPDGRRALVIGQPYGSPVVYHVVEHRPTGAQFSATDVIPQAIANWGAAPFFANSNTHLLAAAFRPGVTCDEGLLVGQDPGPSWNPTLGTVVRFRDTDARDCP